MRHGLGLLMLIGLVGTAWGQRPLDVPPLVLGPLPESTLPSGTPVSRPLQPVQYEEIIVPKVEVTPQEGSVSPRVQLDEKEAVHPLGRYWETFEYLLWWPQAATLPPLLVAHRGADLPTLGGPNTQMLIGGKAINSTDVSGGRFTLGISLNETETTGVAMSYLFLGTRTVQASFSESGVARPRTLARPVVNAFTGEEEAIPVSVPGQLVGRLEASTSLRATGWELNSFTNLYASPGLRVHAVAGYRYFQLNEGLRLDQFALVPQANGQSVLASLADQIDAHNRFHGGQLGLQADLVQGPIFVEASGKVGLGQAVGAVRISGQTVALTNGAAMPLQYYPNGVLGQASNTGRVTRSTFAILPEAMLKVGYRFRDRSRFYVGYNFLYLNEALRPGDQIDRVLDPGQVPLLNRGAANPMGTDRPGLLTNASEFWVQGLTFGLEYRY